MKGRAHPVRVLVVDDSAVMRQSLTSLLERAGGMVVETAAHPLIAMGKMAKSRPDVVVLDVEMPHMDGLTFLRKIMAEDPLPVVICSGHAQRGTREAIEALSLGAVEVVSKPRLGLKQFLEESGVGLAEIVRTAAGARVSRRVAPGTVPHDVPRATVRGPGEASAEVIAIGASTGGPQALHSVLGALPETAPGVVVVQHMPAPFTGPFARRLNEVCRIVVREARDGDRVLRGQALIAPGDRHLELTRRGDGFAVRLGDGPLVSRHRPSVNVLFHSVARVAGPRAVGLILTGMGDDGVEGLAAMKDAGSATVAQDEASCVVFGMPRAAIERVGVDRVVSLSRIPAALLTLAGEAPRAAASAG